MALNKKINTFFHKRRNKVLLLIIILLVIIRIILPYVILHFANERLSKIKNYYGHIEDIDLSIYRGAYTVKAIYLHKKDSISHIETEFFDSPITDLSIHWRALLKGRIVGEIELQNPTLRFEKSKTEPAQIQKDSSDFRKLLDDFMPLQVNYFEINNGNVKYIDKNSRPAVNIGMTNTHITAENLSNVKSLSLLPSTVDASANVYGGTIHFNMKFDPFAKDPTFDMNTELNNTDLTQLNNFFKAYGKFTVSKGTFGLYMEGAGKDGNFIGYLKPIIKNLRVLGEKNKNDNLLEKFWEGIVGGISFILKNQRHDQLATKIPLEGTFKNSRVNIWYSILDVFINAFVQALRPSIDYEININSVNFNSKKEEKKGIFKKLVKPKKENKSEGKK